MVPSGGNVFVISGGGVNSVMRVPVAGGEGAGEYGVVGGSDHGGSGGLSGSLYSIVVVASKSKGMPRSKLIPGGLLVKSINSGSGGES